MMSRNSSCSAHPSRIHARPRVHVLKGVSFEARRGQVYAIVGPSGCGKSTLLYLLGLLDQPDAGEIAIKGQVMSNNDCLLYTSDAADE